MENTKQLRVIELIKQLYSTPFSTCSRSELSALLQAYKEALTEANEPLIKLSYFLRRNYPFEVTDQHDYKALVDAAIKLLTPVEIQDVFKAIFDQLEICFYHCEGGDLEKNSAYIQLKNLLATRPVLGLARDRDEEITKAHGQKVYARLIKICLDCYQCSKTDVTFDEWMELRGLVKKNGFFIPVENYVPQ